MNTAHTTLAKKFLWWLLYAAQHLFVLRHPRLTVLLYHSISNESDFFAVSPGEFQKQMSYLRKYYNVVGPSETEAFLRGRPLQKDSVMITFDDGYCDVADVAGPILKKNSMTGTVFVITGAVDSADLGNTLPRITLTELARLQEFGFTIGSHGCTHRKLTRLKEQDARRELEESRMRIAANAPTPTTFAYPKGAYNTHVAQLARDAGYSLAFTTEARAVLREDNSYAVPRVQIDTSVDFDVFKMKLTPAQDWYHALWMFVMRHSHHTP